MSEEIDLSALVPDVVSDGKYLNINGGAYTMTDLSKVFRVLVANAPDSASELKAKLLTKSDIELASLVKANFKKWSRDHRPEGALEPFYRCIDTQTSREFLIVPDKLLVSKQNKAYEIISDIPFKTYMKTLPKKLATEMNYGLTRVNLYYDPLDMDRCKWTSEEYGETIWNINTYEKPPWMFAVPTEDTKPLELFMKLFDYLFVEPEEHPYLKAWFCEAISWRCPTYLVLRGAQGTGKTTLVQILARLVGSWSIAKDEFLEDKFNAMLEDNRFIYMEEARLDKAAERKLKSYTNDRAAIEDKFVSVKKNIKIYSSFALLNNLNAPNYSVFEDRRKVQPTLNDTDLRHSPDVLSPSDLKYLNHVLPEKPEDLASIGRYILKHWSAEALGVDIREPVRGLQFWEDCLTSLKEDASMKGYYAEYIIKGTEPYYLVRDIHKAYKRDMEIKSVHSRKPSPATLEKWAKEFRWHSVPRDEQVFSVETQKLPTGDHETRLIPHPNLNG